MQGSWEMTNELFHVIYEQEVHRLYTVHFDFESKEVKTVQPRAHRAGLHSPFPALYLRGPGHQYFP